jgi:hypothetical protein
MGMEAIQSSDETRRDREKRDSESTRASHARATMQQ